MRDNKKTRVCIGRSFHHTIGIGLNLWLILALPACSGGLFGFKHPDTLSAKVQDLEVSYAAYSCDCAQWRVTETGIPDSIADLPDHHIYIEPADSSVKIPSAFEACCAGNTLQLTGQFYEELGYPLHYHSFQFPEPARVFRYTKWRINFPYSIHIDSLDQDSILVSIQLQDQSDYERWKPRLLH